MRGLGAGGQGAAQVAAALRGCGVDERGEDVLVDRVVGQARHPVAGGLVVAEGQDDFAGDRQVGAFRVEFGQAGGELADLGGQLLGDVADRLFPVGDPLQCGA
ncbi:hypothetical protein ACWGRV_08280 [Streptomyces sp. NPDC055663]